MREFIGIDVLANTVSMLSSSTRGVIWLSDCDDEAMFYESRCAHPSAMVLPAPMQAHEVLVSLRKRGMGGIIATISSCAPSATRDEFFLSAGDVTSLLVFSVSCKRLIEEIGGRAWYMAADNATDGFHARVKSVGAVLGLRRRARGISSKNRSECVALLSEIVNWNLFELKLGSEPLDTKHEATGEDVLTVLSGALINFRPRGIKSNRSPSPDDLLAILRTGYDIEEFENDHMCLDMRAWQRSKSLPILREWRMQEPFCILLDQRNWEPDLDRLLSHPGSDSMAVFKLDLDNFKSVNERLGHSAGDDALRTYCGIVKEGIGKLAEIYRRGGDEIIAFAPSITASQARAHAEAIRLKIERDFKIWGEVRGLEVTPTASIGLVICGPIRTKSQLIAAADRAQQEAKSSGKNRVVEVLLQG